MRRTAFTLMELLIVVCILIILSTGVVILINPISIINKGTDTARKKDLDDAKKMLEQYMNDTGCYPKPTQVCIDGNNTSGTCHICTKEQSPSFSYFTKDICDPRHGIADYLYQTETIPGYKPPGGVWIPPAVSACPKWFRIYSVLDSVYSAAEDIWGCKKGGCGVSPYYGYSYLVTSPGAPSETIFAGDWGCYTLGDCNNCASFENCTSPINICYGKEIYPSMQSCCTKYSRLSKHCIGLKY